MDRLKTVGKISNYIINVLKLIFISFASVYVFGAIAAIIKSQGIDEWAKIFITIVLAMGAILIIFDEVLKLNGSKIENTTK